MKAGENPEPQRPCVRVYPYEEQWAVAVDDEPPRFIEVRYGRAMYRAYCLASELEGTVEESMR